MLKMHQVSRKWSPIAVSSGEWVICQNKTYCDRLHFHQTRRIAKKHPKIYLHWKNDWNEQDVVEGDDNVGCFFLGLSNTVIAATILTNKFNHVVIYSKVSWLKSGFFSV